MRVKEVTPLVWPPRSAGLTVTASEEVGVELTVRTWAVVSSVTLTLSRSISVTSARLLLDWSENRRVVNVESATKENDLVCQFVPAPTCVTDVEVESRVLFPVMVTPSVWVRLPVPAMRIVPISKTSE